ncbi:hypothetical protein R1sor_013640 [Riccia sorocarpa]|uniref:SET domain-containing protein n=1 Tax=Riccia sorocarpa TaxID=122646 RepID=A0ABD3H942_9MARC
MDDDSTLDRYGPYAPPAGNASTSTFSPLLDISVEEIVWQAMQPAMDQLAERLCTEISIVRGAAADTYRTSNSTHWGVPASIPTREMVTMWGRRWIVKESTIPNTGLGVFAVDRIVVESNTPYDMFPQLFPYVGEVYKHRQYRIMRRYVPFFQDYILDTSQRVLGGPQKRRFIDGDPVRTGNIAGYIQSSLGTSRVSNAEWHYVDGGHIWFHRKWNKGFHIMTVATRTIEPGEEIFGFDPPEIEAFSRRARRRLESLRDDPDDDNQDENEEEEEEPVEERFIPEEPNEPDEELQDQAALAEFFNM